MLLFEKVTPAFCDVLSVLHASCFDKPWDKDAFSSLLSLPTTSGLINDKAFILCSVCLDEAEILTIGVVPEARQQGIGLELLNQMQALLKEQGVSKFFLDVNEKNMAARKLYAKFGFLQVGLRKGYYIENGQKFDALLLKKYI